MAVELNFLQIIWFVLLIVVMVAYYVLDGFDLGVGALYPFIGKTEEDKSVLINIIGPVWDGNEVWLLTLGGALFAAFPPAYATTFSGFYLAIMLVLFCLIMRAVSIHFANDKSHGMRGFWRLGFFLGSALPALLYGVAVGNLLNGVPMLENGDVAGAFPARFIQLLGILPLLCGVLSLLMAIQQGAAWTAAKTHIHTDLHRRAVKVRNVVTPLTLIVFIASSALYVLYVAPRMPEVGTHYFLGGAFAIIRYVLAALVVVTLLFLIARGKKDGKELSSFIISSASIALIILVLAFSLFPALVPSGTPQLALFAQETVGPTITIGAPYASSDTALLAMFIIACIGVPIVLIYHVIAYKAFFGKVDINTYEEHY